MENMENEDLLEFMKSKDSLKREIEKTKKLLSNEEKQASGECVEEFRKIRNEYLPKGFDYFDQLTIEDQLEMRGRSRSCMYSKKPLLFTLEKRIRILTKEENIIEFIEKSSVHDKIR